MPTYIALMNWTDEGIKNIRDAPKRAENAKRQAQKMGGKMEIHYTMGEYDAVAIIEMPNDEAYNKFALSTAALGNTRTKTLKAWTVDELKKTLEQLP